MDRKFSEIKGRLRLEKELVKQQVPNYNQQPVTGGLDIKSRPKDKKK